MNARFRLAATCSRGLESVVAKELKVLGLPAGELARGAVRFRGTLQDAYRGLLWSRTASRILLEIGHGRATSERSLYDTVRGIDWTRHLSVDRTFAVDFVGGNAGIRHSGFGARRVKDGICDALRDATGRRPSVDRHDPDLRVHVYLLNRHATISVDLAGPPLHLRSGGVSGAAAPLKETLAASLLRIAGWPKAAAEGRPLVDPMCGSGTFLREAAGMARGDAPGLRRSRWGFQGWAGHQPTVWQGLLAQAQARPAASIPPIHGSDRDPQAIAITRAGLSSLGLGDAVQLSVLPLSDRYAPEGVPGLLVTNPPYGGRVGDQDQAAATMGELGDILRQRFLGWRAWVLAGSVALSKHLGLRPAQRIPVWNGRIDCRWLDVPISSQPVKGGTPRVS